jgi:hypothetical protein
MKWQSFGSSFATRCNLISFGFPEALLSPLSFDRNGRLPVATVSPPSDCQHIVECRRPGSQAAPKRTGGRELKYLRNHILFAFACIKNVCIRRSRLVVNMPCHSWSARDLASAVQYAVFTVAWLLSSSSLCIVIWRPQPSQRMILWDQCPYLLMPFATPSTSCFLFQENGPQTLDNVCGPHTSSSAA